MGHVYTKNGLLLTRDSDFTGEPVFYLAAILHSSPSPAPVSSLAYDLSSTSWGISRDGPRIWDKTPSSLSVVTEVVFTSCESSCLMNFFHVPTCVQSVQGIKSGKVVSAPCGWVLWPSASAHEGSQMNPEPLGACCFVLLPLEGFQIENQVW